MNNCTKPNPAPFRFSLCVYVAAVLVIAGGATNIVSHASASTEAIAEVKEGNDPEVTVADSNSPQVFAHGDQRSVCQDSHAGLDFIPFKIKNESAGQCLRPSGGSAQENVAIILSNCENTRSRYWIQKRVAYGLGFQLENMKTGKCIQRVGSQLLQRTCSLGGSQIRYQTWNFHDTPPLESGSFLRSWTGCAHALGKAQAHMARCQNDSDQRWYQTGF